MLVEPANMQTREVPDVLGFLPNGDSILIEVKRSLQDFKRDAKKNHRQSIGMGFTRYYLTPTGLLKETDLPDDRWGWLEVSEGTGKVFLRRKGVPFPKAHEIRAEEMPIILHQLKKAGRREKTAIFADTDDKLFEKAARLYMSRKGKGVNHPRPEGRGFWPRSSWGSETSRPSVSASSASQRNRLHRLHHRRFDG